MRKHDKVYNASVLAEAIYKTYRAEGASRWHAFKQSFLVAILVHR